jgi:hypothetical protein
MFPVSLDSKLFREIFTVLPLETSAALIFLSP